MVLDAAGDLARRSYGVHAATRLAAVLLIVLAVPGPVAAAPAAVERVVVGLEWRNSSELERSLMDVANPQSESFDHYLTAATFASRFGPSAAGIDAVRARLLGLGFTTIEQSPGGALLSASGPGASASPAAFVSAADLLQDDAVAPATIGPGAAVAWGRSSGSPSVELHPPTIGPSLPPQVGSPFEPSDIARIYNFDRLYAAGIRGGDERSSTIAIATAFDLDRTALERFWQEVGIARSPGSVEVIAVGGALGQTHAETTLDVEWASAMAPGAHVLVYAAPSASAASFLQVYDRIVADNRAAVLTTSWGLCERDMPSAMRQQAHTIFQRAAAQGITVLAASGDNGAFDCGPDRPGVSFPASDPFVLAVGGTSLRDDGHAVRESAWKGSGGGSSSTWSAPPWQMADHPNRVMADVAFNADPGSGFLAFIDGGWWSYGGTSVAAPCWAAVVALINQRRAEHGRDTLGLAAPALCEIAHSPTMASLGFHDVMTGSNDAFAAVPGWDFPTGWGTPQAGDLAEALATWDPPASATGAASQSLVLSPEPAGSGGMAIARFSRRCLTTLLRLRVHEAPPSRYTLALDEQPVASFDVGDDGAAAVDLTNVDPRGHALLVRDGSGELVFSGSFPASPPAPLQFRVPLMSTGSIPGAGGGVTYRRAGGREAFSVSVQAVPSGDYGVRIGARLIGTLSVKPGRRSARVRFDSTGVSGVSVPVSPLCQVIAVIRDDVIVLRTRTSALMADSCS